jgi:predicted transcriptional regulator
MRALSLVLGVLALAHGFAAAALAAAPEIGKKLPTVKLEGDDGGLVKDGGAWSSDMIKGKVWAFFYVDPDFRDSNEELAEAIKAAEFPAESFGSIAVTNMEASGLPNFIISSALKSKQEKFERTVYVKDMNKVLVSKWGLKDDAYVVMIFGKDGTLLSMKDGDFSKDDTKALIDLVNAHLADPAS